MKSFSPRSSASLSGRILANISLRYGMAVVAAVLAWLINRALIPLAGPHEAYLLFFPGVAFSAWYCGIGPSLLATGLGFLGATYGLTFPPRFRVLSFAEAISGLVFVLSSVIVVALGESRRRQNTGILQAQGELELRVQERTADLDKANQNLRELSARLLQLQDDERRRIARELHDSVGQMLAALGMNLSAVRGDIEHLVQTTNTLIDSENLMREMSSEVRTISHLLHPPLLDEAGLSSALRWYVEGFSQRSKIKVELDLPSDFGRLPRESETAIFRVVQESLTNIHRHSGSPVATIRLRQRYQQVLVEIEDRGHGIPPDKQEEIASAGAAGVGIRGMRERLRQLGGTLEISSSESGTVVAVWLPIPEASAVVDALSESDKPSPAAA